jgi:hypothetical protein
MDNLARTRVCPRLQRSARRSRPTHLPAFSRRRLPSNRYKVTLSAEGGIDVTQADQAVKSTAFSGALGCEGIRKSVKFDLAAAPFTVELSSVKADSIKVVVSRD